MFRMYESQLGNNARLGLSFYLIDVNGDILKKDGYNETLPMPMASTKKIAVALAVLKKLFSEEAYSLESKVNILDQEFSPGPPTNSLDRYYFFPWHCEQEKTINDLLTLMLTESDNTATDRLLALVGINAVNQLMEELNFKEYKLVRNSKALLSDYFETSGNKSIINIIKTLYQFISAYSLRPTESVMFTEERDTCTPQCMSLLLKLLVEQSKKDDGQWLSQAAKIICEKMQQCKTGANLIKKAIQNYSGLIEQFGHKTGGLGGIRNDAAFIKLNNNQTIVLSIYTCLTPLELSKREEIISSLALELINKNIPIENDKISTQTSGVAESLRTGKRSFCGIL